MNGKWFYEELNENEEQLEYHFYTIVVCSISNTESYNAITNKPTMITMDYLFRKHTIVNYHKMGTSTETDAAICNSI